MDIFAEIKGIKYQTTLLKDLKVIELNSFDINNSPTCCVINQTGLQFSISRWVSPKRTRSYPFERVYNTLNGSKKITVIPIIKDEGLLGDRDFIQWDTVSLMSLLDVYVIFSYYESAEKHTRKENKITNQKMNNAFIKNKIVEISNYLSSPLHWNLQETRDTLPLLINKVISSYDDISKKLNVDFHGLKGIEKFKSNIAQGEINFMDTSRQKASDAQNREYHTTQPKEALATLSKAKITIKNYLGGLYYLTTDEIEIKEHEILLIEAKHSKNSKLPSISDIKDGLLKIILYCNLEEVMVDGIKYAPKPVLKLTSENISGKITSDSSIAEVVDFYFANNLSTRQKNLIDDLLIESRFNGIYLIIEKGTI